MGYLGSKAASGAYQAIIAKMPAHDTYIETHLGSGTIMRRKPLANRSIGIDVDPVVIKNIRGFKKCELYCTDAKVFLEQFDYTTAGRVLVYCDPPYLHATRTSKERYAYEYTDNDHRELLAVLQKIKAYGVDVMLSGYPSTLYDELLPEWPTVEFQVMTRGGVRTEKLWLSDNFDSMHWAVYAGDNFSERQRIKRKALRWAKKYQALPLGERLAVMSAMLKCD